jgi:cytochrome c
LPESGPSEGGVSGWHPGVETIVEHITSGHMVQLSDGTDEKHKIIDTRDPAELRNLALWILSL